MKAARTQAGRWLRQAESDLAFAKDAVIRARAFIEVARAAISGG